MLEIAEENFLICGDFNCSNINSMSNNDILLPNNYHD